MKIILIGLPGSGKTTLGRELARSLQLPFVDLDNEIEKTEGAAIKVIFSEKKEDYFRQLESNVLKKWCASSDSFVMATGGGAPCFFDNMEQINRAGTSIFLDVSSQEIIRRMMTSKIEERPLLAASGVDGLKEKIESMRANRIGFYQQAHITLTGTTIELQQALAALANIKS